jgi:chemotaxis signal transduction protein
MMMEDYTNLLVEEEENHWVGLVVTEAEEDKEVEGMEAETIMSAEVGGKAIALVPGEVQVKPWHGSKD